MWICPKVMRNYPLPVNEIFQDLQHLPDENVEAWTFQSDVQQCGEFLPTRQNHHPYYLEHHHNGPPHNPQETPYPEDPHTDPHREQSPLNTGNSDRDLCEKEEKGTGKWRNGRCNCPSDTNLDQLPHFWGPGSPSKVCPICDFVESPRSFSSV